VKRLSEVAGKSVEEVFIGPCMTNIGLFRAAGILLDAAGTFVPTSMWFALLTKIDAASTIPLTVEA